MQNRFKLIQVLLVISINMVFGNTADTIHYMVDLTNVKDDLFHVIVYPKGLTTSSNLFNFPATAPGIYTNIDFGRYIKSFKAYNKKGDEITSFKTNTNQWEIENPENVYKIEYDIEDTYDSSLDTVKVFPMCGTAIEDGFIILNTFGVLGYFNDKQSCSITLTLNYPKDYLLGTSLEKAGVSVYQAENYDKLADSPILLGKLSKATTYVNNIAVNLFVYTTDSLFRAENIIGMVDTLLQSASSFIDYSPVKSYSFLMCLLPDSIRLRQGQMGGGALEHNQSSLYFLPADMNELSMLKDVVIHEFLHILTPLNAHSELIHNYDFINPKPSKHIWFYEGVTEWGSTVAQMRCGYKSLQQYLQKITDYLRLNDAFKKDYSLCEMSLESYTNKGRKTFLNFYNRGAITAGLLDIRLLELSNGEKGLRELLLSLVKEYGKDKCFKDEEFFEIIVKKTYPEIQDFIDKYICGTEPLPLTEYFNKVGIEYIYEKPADSDKPSIGSNIGMNDNGEIITQGVTTGADYGLKEEDVILEIFGEKLTIENIKDVLDKKNTMKIGDHFPIKIKRDGEEISLNGVMSRFIRRHVFSIMENPTPDQLALREVWTQNL